MKKTPKEGERECTRCGWIGAEEGFKTKGGAKFTKWCSGCRLDGVFYLKKAKAKKGEKQ